MSGLTFRKRLSVRITRLLDRTTMLRQERMAEAGQTQMEHDDLAACLEDNSLALQCNPCAPARVQLRRNRDRFARQLAEVDQKQAAHDSDIGYLFVVDELLFHLLLLLKSNSDQGLVAVEKLVEGLEHQFASSPSKFTLA